MSLDERENGPLNSIGRPQNESDNEAGGSRVIQYDTGRRWSRTGGESRPTDFDQVFAETTSHGSRENAVQKRSTTKSDLNSIEKVAETSP